MAIGLITNALTNSSRGTQYEPEAVMEYARQNRINHITFTTLHFCPKWYEALYIGKPFQVNTSMRLMLKTTGDGEMILNPEKEPFGWSLNNVNLRDVDEETVRTSWAGRPNTEGGLTFDSITELGSAEMDIFHLDTQFANHKISAYRLRGNGISSPHWVSLNATN